MDRRFVCQECGTKWFIHEHRTAEPDLTECGRCGGPLVRMVAASGGGDGYGYGYGSLPDEPEEELP